jgi:thiamine biosynthesis lipoprotein
MRTGLLLVWVIGAPLAFAAPKKLIRLERSAPAMGTGFTVDLYGTSAGALEAAAESALEEAQRLDRMLSDYRPDSELSQVNEHALERPVKVSREFFDLLSACLDYSRRSEGSFDITVGALMRVWGFYKGSGHLPHHAEVAAALEHVGYRHVILDAQAQTVRFDKAGLALDPGGVGKGYAVDKMVGVLKDSGIDSALVSGGGSSIYGMGAPPDDARGWYVKIRDPWDRNKKAAEIYLRDQSLSTSGNYEKFFRAEGKLYSHIMDPRSGYPAQGVVAVSVLAPKTLDSEVWAKPYYILGRAWTEIHKPKDFRVLMCENRVGVACEWVK